MKHQIIESKEGSVIILDDVYSQNTYNTILNQVLGLVQLGKIEDHDVVGTATTTVNSSNYLSHRKGLWIDDFFAENRHDFIYFAEHSNTIKKLTSDIKSLPFVFRGIEVTNWDESLLGVYSNNDGYRPHKDNCFYSSIFFLHDEKKFSGGDLIFDDMDIKIEFIKNRLVLFPSWARHGVSKVVYPENYKPKFNEFRMSITTFYQINYHK
jgi:Rps23 Pro-64 3,4-dihydroxylase Tpa1-like proline 4-hydroxylase